MADVLADVSASTDRDVISVVAPYGDDRYDGSVMSADVTDAAPDEDESDLISAKIIYIYIYIYMSVVTDKVI